MAAELTACISLAMLLLEGSWDDIRWLPGHHHEFSVSSCYVKLCNFRNELTIYSNYPTACNMLWQAIVSSNNNGVWLTPSPG
jgi:hypothetical protein